MEYITDIRQEVLEKIKSVGYEILPSDDFLINESIEKVKEYICNKTNQNNVPFGLKYIFIDRVFAEFLIFKMKLSQLNLEGIDFERIVKEINEGDVRLVYNDTKTSGDNLEAYLKELTIRGESEFSKYRRFVW